MRPPKTGVHEVDLSYYGQKQQGGPRGRQHGEEEEEEDEEELAAGGGGEEVQLQGDSTRDDLRKLTAVNVPIPRGAMHLKKVRSPHYHRTQYLSNLGIWAKKEAQHLNSSRPTEARYKSTLGSEASVKTKTSSATNTPVSKPGKPPSATTSETRARALFAGEATATASAATSESPRSSQQQQQASLCDAIPGRHGQGEEEEIAPSPYSSPSESNQRSVAGGLVMWPRSNAGGGRGGVEAMRADSEAAATLWRSSSSLIAAALDGEEGAEGGRQTQATAAPAAAVAAAVAVAVAAPATSQSPAAGGPPAAGGVTSVPPGAAGTAGSLAPANRADSHDRNSHKFTPSVSSTKAGEELYARSETHLASAASASRSASRPIAINPPLPAIAVPSLTASLASFSSASSLSSSISSTSTSSSSSLSSRVRTERTVADPLKVGSPPLRAVRPPRRDIRRDYLTNLGMSRAVVAGPGDTRTPPPIMRRSSFIESVGNPVEEQLKDPNAGAITFQGVLRVVGSILTGGGEKEPRSRPCRTCERLRRSATANGASSSSSPPEGHHRSMSWQWGGNGRPANGAGGSGGGAGVEAVSMSPCGHKQVDFAPVVSAVYVPVHSEYSDRVRRSYWNSAGEIREMVYRNMIEFDAEEYNWENVAEEEDMYFCEETGEFIHPIFFDSQDEAREVRATSPSSSEPEAEEHVEFINEGRGMPVMQQPA